MLKTRSLLFVAGAFFQSTMIVGSVAGAEAVLLRYKFHAGDTVDYMMTTNHIMSMAFEVMPEKPQNVSMNMKIKLHHKINMIQDNTATILIGFDQYDVETKLGRTKYPTPHLDEIKKLQLEIKMSDRGEITSSKLLNEGEINPQFKQMAESIRSSIAHNIVILPEKPIKPGDQWSIEQEVPTNLPGAVDLKMQIKANYKYIKSFDVKGEKRAEIGMEMKMLLMDKTVQGQPLPIEANLSGAGEGTCQFSITKGRMVRNLASFNLGGTTTTQDPRGNKISSQLKMKVKYTMEAS